MPKNSLLKNVIPATDKDLHAYISGNGELPKSKKIDGIRRIWHDLKCENFLLESCLAAVMKQFGEPSDYYDNCTLLQSISGSLFTLAYPGSSDAHGLTHEIGQQLMPHICEQLGYSYLYIDNSTIKNHYELVLDAIKISIAKSIPVISYGIGNIPLDNGIEEHHSEWCNIGGYEEDGTLHVNSLHEGQSTCDENGYFPVKNGLTMSKGMYIFDKKIRENNLGDITRNAIRTIPAFISIQPQIIDDTEVKFGQEAYYAWADTLLDETNFTDYDAWKKIHHFGYFVPWVTALTCEVHIRLWFDRIAELSEMPEALLVKDIFTRIHAQLSKLQELHGGDFDANYDVIKNPDVRQELAAILRHMGDLHNEVFTLFEV